MRLAAAAAAAVIWVTAGGASADQPPAALVMALTGSVTPDIAAMAEIPPGVTLRLAPGTELTFLHYARCKLVTVSGGTLSVTGDDFASDGKLVGETAGPCPHVHQLAANAEGSVAGGLVMRGLGATPRWPLVRDIVVAGAGADKLAAAVVFAEGRLDAPLVRLETADHHARFPADAAPLAPNQRYVLRLTLRDRAEPVDLAFISTAPSLPSLLVVLRGP